MFPDRLRASNNPGKYLKPDDALLKKEKGSENLAGFQTLFPSSAVLC